MTQAPLPTAASLESTLAHALDLAKQRGASQAEGSISVSRALTVMVRLGEVESVELQRDRDLHIEVQFGQRSGQATTNDLSPEALLRTVQAACDIAQSTGEDPYSGLADPALLGSAGQDLALHHPWEVTVEQLVERARACEAVALQNAQNSEGASFDTREGISAYANSHGFFGASEGTSYSLSCSVLAEKNGDMQTAYDYDSRRDWRDLRSEAAIGLEAARQAQAKLGARRLPTQKAKVLFAAEVAKGLYKSILSGIRGAALHRKSSFLLDKQGELVLSPFLSLSSRPFLAKASNSSNFDSEGIRAQNRDLVVNGILQEYLLDSYSARKMGLAPNSGQAFNVLVESQTMHDFKTLLRELGSGLYITDLMGQGVNMVTGDYSRGAAGFWVENGEIAYPVQEITVAGNLGQMLQNIVAVGNDIDTRGGLYCGSVLIESLQIAGE
jgi:PmbA protein